MSHGARSDETNGTEWAATLEAWRSRRLAGPFQQLVVLALVRLGPDCPARDVRLFIEKWTGRPTSATAVHTTLGRLEKRGHVVSWRRPPRPSPFGLDRDRAGPRWESAGTRRFFSASTLGWKALRATLKSADRLRPGLPGLGRSGETFCQARDATIRTICRAPRLRRPQLQPQPQPRLRLRLRRGIGPARTRAGIRSRILGAPMIAPRIDVILPVRCARNTLPVALDDALGQVGVDVRVLAVVDAPAAGDDGSAAWLAERARGEPRLEVIEGPGRGVGAALDVGLARVTSEWLAHMEADDRCQPDRLSRQLAAASASAAASESAAESAAGLAGGSAAASAVRTAPLAAVACCVAQSGARTPGMSRYLGWQNSLLMHEEMARERWVEIPAMHQTGLYRTRAVRECGGYTPRGEWPADIDFWFRWFEPAGHDHAPRGTLKLPLVLYHWRQHPGQSTRSASTHTLAVLRDAKAHYLARAIGRKGASPRPVHLVSTGRTLAAWAGALRRAGIELSGRTDWRTDGQLPPEVLRDAGRGALVLAAYGNAIARQRVRGSVATSVPPLLEPDDLLFSA
jgi:hypothetical protein